LKDGADFSELVAIWLMSAVELLLREGLEDDYYATRDRSSAVRGSIDVRKTTLGWLSGDARVECSFDEFGPDSPLNRILKAALTSVSGNRQISEDTRAAARGLVLRLWEIGDLRPEDAVVQPRRGQLRYLEPLGLAKQILAAVGRSLEGGSLRSSSFLFPTPLLIEEGIRSILQTRLAPVPVRRHGRLLLPSSVSVNPDLEVGPPPFTGDVKYKIADSSWNRSDLAQAVFFATAYRSPLALIVNFRNRDVANTDLLQVGAVRVGSATWNATPDADPEVSEEALVSDVRRVLNLPLA
jgi:5-methylcytosine-specific restriction endonuclease McrBC regulatory subunit McrC